jgi:hypothetical protein
MNHTCINPLLDLNALTADYKEQKQVVIDQFLVPETAESLYSFLTKEMPADWWIANSRPHVSGQDEPHYIRNTPGNSQLILNAHECAASAYAQGDFAFHFLRTMPNHYDECDCKECHFRSFLGSREMLDFISDITGRTYSEVRTIFASCYLPGSFLAPHDDGNNGTLTFVLQLTKNWLPQWGGLLHFLEDDNFEIQKVLVPRFNSLLLFDLPEKNNRNHFVSPVAAHVTVPRLSYTGWF